MADGKQFEYGQSASEVQFQDEVGKIKNRQGEAVIEVNDDQEFFLATSGDSVKIKTLIDDDAFGVTATDTALATAESIKAYVDAAGGGSGSFDDITVDTNTLVANITGYTDKVGVATATPRRTLDVLDASNPQLRLTHTDNTEYTDIQTQSNGDTAITMNGSAGGMLYVRGDANYTYMQIQNQSTGHADGTDDGLTVGCNLGGGTIKMRDASSTLTLGCGDIVAITIDATRNATFVANLSADGNVTLGDASDDIHTVNGTMTIPDGLTYKPSTVVHAAASEAGPATVATSGTTYLITDESGFLTLPEAVDANRGTQYVVANGTGVDSDTGSGMVRRTGSTDSFYTGSTTSTSVEVGKYAAKTFIVIGDDKWLVIG